ncbi:MAG: acyl-CoA dehydrogenase family protein, partial [Nitrospinota bacterium]
RDCKLLTVGEGSNEIQRIIIARRLLELYPV